LKGAIENKKINKVYNGLHLYFYTWIIYFSQTVTRQEVWGSKCSSLFWTG